ncbi:NADAR family protein [Chryseobacterium defluvii]|uniref:NADAR domain-containing protein n=1 Tax=Chryseobacterium defluvii TaxID=160396 RepID=A0A495SNQ3_9FLAO|nr:NADAR family protein [Chryseobacterium defluvii]RKT01873.1 hypothetical protein BCF58_1099 [Chryseobacterium defluvii]
MLTIGIHYLQENISFVQVKYSIRTYHYNNCITFKSTKSKFGALSNMAPNFPISINNDLIKTSEALYQALKFNEFPDIQKKIIDAYSPMIAKRISRHYDMYTRSDWEYTRFKVMKFCIETKLQQNYNSFSSILLQTGDKPIVEYTMKDKVWGAVLDGNIYEGTNALGRLLMELREKIKSNTFQYEVPDLIIKHFKLLGKEINNESIKKFTF